ncbi:MAG: hypothetical protein Q4A07_10150 [Coriobacteriales bacterium]|nr:hypothetical protein [Coriobacteriales bacterium]
MSDQKTTQNILPRIVLDGPSALTLFRDRDDRAASVHEFVYEPENDFVPEYLSDEDVAATLGDTNVFGHRTLDRLLQHGDLRIGIPSFSRSRAQGVARCVTRSRELKLVPYGDLGLRPPADDSPLYLLVPNAESKRRVRNVSQRACTTRVTPDSFKRLGDVVLVPKPEFAYVLLAHHLSFVELIVVGMEMCGRYRLTGAPSNQLLVSSGAIYDCDQLMTPTSMHDYANQNSSFPGAALALRTCKYLVPNSSSPMETIVYLLLCLPRSMGGYGLPKPQLNAKRVVNTYAGSITFSRTLIPDLYWPSARLDMEYDSDEFHSDAESLAKGARRALALRAMHVDVISMTRDIVYDESAFHAAARLVSSRLGIRFRPFSESALKKRRELRELLLWQN